MKVNSTYPGFPLTTPAIHRPSAAPEAAPPQPESAIAPKDRLAKLLEERHTQSEAAIQGSSAEPQLGQHIDLRV